MKYLFLFIVILLASNTAAQDKSKLIGEIEFFGYAGVDLNKVKAALPIHEKDDFSLESFSAQAEALREAIKQAAGRAPTDLGSTCCDDQGNWIVFIGLSGRTPQYNHPSGSRTRLPKNIVALYERFIKVNMEEVQKGAAAEDHSKGYALSVSGPLRSIQLEMRAYALNRTALLQAVLEGSADDEQRIVAAELLGYARRSRAQISSLVKANRDSNGTVRNNATRALLVLVDSNIKVAAQIPVADFVVLLLSGTWTDINKASGLLFNITRYRDAKVLAQLRTREVLNRLIEMARWRVGHGNAARYILGRLAAIDEEKLVQLVTAGQIEEIIKQLPQTRNQGGQHPE
jgi:hypothetical protein